MWTQTQQNTSSCRESHQAYLGPLVLFVIANSRKHTNKTWETQTYSWGFNYADEGITSSSKVTRSLEDAKRLCTSAAEAFLENEPPSRLGSKIGECITSALEGRGCSARKIVAYYDPITYPEGGQGIVVEVHCLEENKLVKNEYYFPETS
tara:strand:- start:42 stop:491 length:450 start_codon:yes stop_codon:yes gene_type:complete